MMRESLRRKLFGTDGIRGQANVHPMTCEVALALGRAVAYQARSGSHRHRIVIGKDTRLSGYMIEMAFASGVCSMGIDALLVGPMPTPGVAFLTQNMRADAGVVISASHNPYQDNGIKIFDRDGYKLPDNREIELEELMTDEKVSKIRPTKSAVGKAFRIDDAMGRYIVALKSVLPTSLDLSGLNIVVDCAHGAAYKVAPTILRELGAHVWSLGVNPDGRNINHRRGALYPENLAKAVIRYSADIGLALDGDADRLVVVDEKGQILSGDAILALGAQELLRRGQLRHRLMVATIMSNVALEQFINKLGGKLLRAPVGDRYVMELLRQHDANYGGESSGHIIYHDASTTGDGMLAALKLLEIRQRECTPISTLAAVYTPMPQILKNIEVKKQRPLAELTAVNKLLEQSRAHLGTDGRIIVRYSGTEPLVRLLVEGPELAMIEAMTQKLVAAILQALS